MHDDSALKQLVQPDDIEPPSILEDSKVIVEELSVKPVMKADKEIQRNNEIEIEEKAEKQDMIIVDDQQFETQTEESKVTTGREMTNPTPIQKLLKHEEVKTDRKKKPISIQQRKVLNAINDIS